MMDIISLLECVVACNDSCTTIDNDCIYTGMAAQLNWELFLALKLSPSTAFYITK